MNEMVQEHGSSPLMPARAQVALSLIGVTKRWGARAVLDDVTFAFLQGQTYVVAGPSGAGKTTLLNLIAGYVAPDAGAVTGPARVGYLFQDDMLFSALTVHDNVFVRAVLRDDDQVQSRIESSLAAVGMLDRAHDLVSTLSGGERQRVQLATVLVGEPQFVLLDEPTASLDPRSRRHVAELVARVFARTTCLVVSHDEQLAAEMGGVEQLVLENGALRNA